MATSKAKTNSGGYIYIMASQSWPQDTYKVGMSGSPKRRARELYTTGLPFPVELVRKARVANMKDAESDLHKELRAKGFHTNKEFFTGELEIIKTLLKKVAAHYDDHAYRQRKAEEKARKKQEKERAIAGRRQQFQNELRTFLQGAFSQWKYAKKFPEIVAAEKARAGGMQNADGFFLPKTEKQRRLENNSRLFQATSNAKREVIEREIQHPFYQSQLDSQLNRFLSNNRLPAPKTGFFSKTWYPFGKLVLREPRPNEDTTVTSDYLEQAVKQQKARFVQEMEQQKTGQKAMKGEALTALDLELSRLEGELSLSKAKSEKERQEATNRFFGSLK